MARNDIPNLAHEGPALRTARISRDRDGVPIGVALFFTSNDLVKTGVNPVTADAVELRIVSGIVLINAVDPTIET
jgi:hypothetical protein